MNTISFLKREGDDRGSPLAPPVSVLRLNYLTESESLWRMRTELQVRTYLQSNKQKLNS